MYAVGRSQGKNPNGRTFWDQEVSYGSTANSIADIPLSLLEIKQNNNNKGINHKKAVYGDYSNEFTDGFRPSASNNLNVSSDGTPTPPSQRGKYIAGHSGDDSYNENGYIPAGSYQSKNNDTSQYHYVLDYRILPGFPAIFPNVFNEDASIAENLVSASKANTLLAGVSSSDSKKSYAEPGFYTMTVQYVIMEDQ